MENRSASERDAPFRATSHGFGGAIEALQMNPISDDEILIPHTSANVRGVV
jgi:hypothetical protein